MQLKASPDIGAFAAMEFSTFELKQGISEAALLAAIEQMVEGGVSVNASGEYLALARNGQGKDRALLLPNEAYP